MHIIASWNLKSYFKSVQERVFEFECSSSSVHVLKVEFYLFFFSKCYTSTKRMQFLTFCPLLVNNQVSPHDETNRKWLIKGEKVCILEKSGRRSLSLGWKMRAELPLDALLNDAPWKSSLPHLKRDCFARCLLC